jgi:kynureninase
MIDYFAALVAQRCSGHALECISPPEAERRGSHISYRSPHAFELCQALIAAGVIGDFRSPT